MTGPAGAAGEPGVLGSYVRSSVFLTIPGDADGGVFVDCDGGDVASGGGFTTRGDPGALRIYEARPEVPVDEVQEDGTEEAALEDGSGTPLVATRYVVRARNDTSDPADLQAWVICLDLADA